MHVVLLVDGEPRALAPFRVATPWWQDMVPVVAALPGIAVLRLMAASPAADHVMGGTVTYLAEPLPPELSHVDAAAGWDTTPWHGWLRDDHRQPAAGKRYIRRRDGRVPHGHAGRRLSVQRMVRRLHGHQHLQRDDERSQECDRDLCGAAASAAG